MQAKGFQIIVFNISGRKLYPLYMSTKRI